MATDDRLELETALIGILALLAAEREERLSGTEPARTELVLANAGLPIRDIAKILGKNYQAVQKVVWRGRPKADIGATGVAGRNVPDDAG